MRTGYLIAASLALHLGVFLTISQRSKQIEKRQTLIAMVEQKKKEQEKKPEPPKPIEVPKEVLQPKVQQAPVAPPVAEPTPSPAMAALPDYGLNLQGGNGATGGIPESDGGAPRGVPAIAAPPAPVEKALGTAQPAGGAKDPDLASDIAAWKPKPTARVKPVYPDEARGWR